MWWQCVCVQRCGVRACGACVQRRVRACGAASACGARVCGGKGVWCVRVCGVCVCGVGKSVGEYPARHHAARTSSIHASNRRKLSCLSAVHPPRRPNRHAQLEVWPEPYHVHHTTPERTKPFRPSAQTGTPTATTTRMVVEHQHSEDRDINIVQTSCPKVHPPPTNAPMRCTTESQTKEKAQTVSMHG